MLLIYHWLETVVVRADNIGHIQSVLNNRYISGLILNYRCNRADYTDISHELLCKHEERNHFSDLLGTHLLFNPNFRLVMSQRSRSCSWEERPTNPTLKTA